MGGQWKKYLLDGQYRGLYFLSNEQTSIDGIRESALIHKTKAPAVAPALATLLPDGRCYFSPVWNEWRYLQVVEPENGRCMLPFRIQTSRPPACFFVYCTRRPLFMLALSDSDMPACRKLYCVFCLFFSRILSASDNSLFWLS